MSLALEYEAFEGSSILPRKPKSEETSLVYSLTKTEDMNTSSTTSDNMISKLLEGFNEMQSSMKKILQPNKDKNEQPRFRGTSRKKHFYVFIVKRRVIRKRIAHLRTTLIVIIVMHANLLTTLIMTIVIHQGTQAMSLIRIL